MEINEALVKYVTMQLNRMPNYYPSRTTEGLSVLNHHSNKTSIKNAVDRFLDILSLLDSDELAEMLDLKGCERRTSILQDPKAVEIANLQEVLFARYLADGVEPNVAARCTSYSIWAYAGLTDKSIEEITSDCKEQS